MGTVGKRQLAFPLPERRAHPTFSFFRISYPQLRDHAKPSSVTY
ncbi:hypothetical protein HMPREF0083_05868 [Aneurinibacillus aneurinilyticus ATCC 12856]|uniref:Uncharacterized protein n=1 Tax=Aneurinibacillus aneurinilyticus ATCC 12856 TaxID=649747 RepID=U1WQR1_ANEAE|nr:hypothetical protein HMPREF0083_05868 [Aneurinibacillus aneurinilyticus ATCC 12856]